MNPQMHTCRACGVRFFPPRTDAERCSTCQAAWDARTAADERRKVVRFARARVWTVAA